ncbi:MAG: RhaT [Clostridia bacterium]|jgi:drug/metabolite transporter (DMT)-like permease|nr:RhaT [Clostridia bacterium]
MNKAQKSDLSLLLVTIFWGAGFPVTKFALQTIPPLYHIGLRFLIAAVLLSIIFYRKMFKIDKSILKPAATMAALLFLTYALQTIGLLYTTASKSAFYSGLAVLFVPMLSFLFYKSKMNVNTIISITLAFLGLYLLSFSGNVFSFNIGDLMTVLNSVSYAVLLLLTSDYVKEHDPTQLSIVQMYIVSLLGFGAALLFDKWDTPMSLLSFNSLMFSAVLCTAFAFWMQATAQKFTSASHVALIFTMEPVFGAFTAWLLLHEKLGYKGFAGGAFIILAMLIAEFDFSTLRARLFPLKGRK